MKKHLIFDLDGTLFDPHDLRRPYPEVGEIIRTLTHSHTLSLLTVGTPSVQWEKLKACNLIGCFKAIVIISKPEDKKNAIEALASVYKTESPRSTIVIGDRIDLEVAYANELGYTSVRIWRGKHAAMVPTTRLERPKHTIKSLVELPLLLEKIV